MKKNALRLAALGLLLSFTPSAATAQEQSGPPAATRFTVDDVNLGTAYQGQVIVRNGRLDACIAIRGVERKQRCRIDVPEGRTVIGIDPVEAAREDEDGWDEEPVTKSEGGRR